MQPKWAKSGGSANCDGLTKDKHHGWPRHQTFLKLDGVVGVGWAEWIYPEVPGEAELTLRPSIRLDLH